MHRYILQRIVHLVPVVLGVVTVVFLTLRLTPGDPAVALAGEKASGEQIERMREALGLNRPLPVQYVEFLGRVATFQLGRSIRTGREISPELLENFAPTIELALAEPGRVHAASRAPAKASSSASSSATGQRRRHTPRPGASPAARTNTYQLSPRSRSGA